MNVDCTVAGEGEGVGAERGRERERESECVCVYVHVPQIIIWGQPHIFGTKNINTLLDCQRTVPEICSSRHF